MAEIIGQALVDVTATAQRVALLCPWAGHTLFNTGSYAAYYRSSSALTATLAGGTEAAMRAAGGGQLAAGEPFWIPPNEGGLSFIDIACITGQTTTVRVEPGQLVPAPVTISGTGLSTSAKQDTQITAEQATAAGVGTTTDAVVGDNTTVAATATAASGISLWKRIVNLLIAVLAKQPALGTAGSSNANVLSVQGIASGTTMPVTEASAASILATMPTDILASTTIVVTNASATLTALLATASRTIAPTLKRLSIMPLGTVSIKIGGAAVSGTNDWQGGLWYEFPAKAATDLRLIGPVASTSAVVIEEG